MKDFSIIIAHRGDPLGLWSTIHSCELELQGSNYDYEYCIVVNGEENSKKLAKGFLMNNDLERVVTFLGKTGKLGHLSVKQTSLSPPSARQLGTEHATGKLLFFLDNHCLVGKNYFARAIHNFDRYDMDMLHSTTKFYEGDITCYEYKLLLKKNFWAEAAVIPADNVRPYKIAAGGHGGFVVKADVWKQVGGYWDGFVGYGGEEIYFDLKMAMLGYTNWIDPLFIHYHYAGKRPYARHFSEGYYSNMLMCANIIGGEKWMNTVYQSFRNKFPQCKTPMFYLLMKAEEKSRDHSRSLAHIAHRTLDEQLEWFVANNIAH